MIKDLKFLLGEDSKLLKKPILMLVGDAIFGMFTYGMLYFVLMDLMKKDLDADKIKIYTVIMVVAFVLRILLNRKGYTAIQTEGARAIQLLRIKLGNHIRMLNMGYFNKNSIGEISSTMISDLTDLEKVLTHSMSSLIKTLVLSVYILSVSFAVDKTMATYQLVMVVVAMPIMYLGGKYLKRVGKEKKSSIKEMISRIVEFMNGIQVLKSYNCAGEKFDRLKQSLLKFKKESIRTEVSIVPFVLLFQLIVDISFPLLLMVGTARFMNQSMDARALLSFSIINLALVNVLRAFGGQYGEFRYMRMALTNLVHVYKQPVMPYKLDDIGDVMGEITFKNVSFSYEDEMVLKDVSFTARPGQKTALVGPSGAGKTTVMSLIARFFDIQEGKIMIDGMNIKSIQPDALLSHIAMVFQEAYLLNDTVYNNLALGKDIPKEKVEEACRQANCYGFIMKMEEGFNTVIGEGGATLSGGEKQRIAIARAMLKDAKILLLDEATASLDADNEYEVNTALKKLMKEKTVIVIAHRLNTILDADQIILLSKGRIEEIGSHEKLMFDKKHYFQMISSLEKAQSWQLIKE